MNAFGGNRILVVEPDSWVRTLLVEFLRFNGFEVFGAADFAAALSCASAFDPHVLLSNYDLAEGASGVSGFSGVDLALALRGLNGLLGLVFLSKLPEQNLGLLPAAQQLAGAQYCSSGDGFSTDELLGSVALALAGVAP